jgi:hypothetical protein
MKKYHLIAYRPNEEDYWYRTNSDCQIYLNMSEDYLVEKWVELEACGGYNFQLICGGSPLNEGDYSYNPDFDISAKTASVFNSFTDRVAVLVRDMKEREEQEAVRKAEQDVLKKAEELKKSEKALLETLKQKYRNE